MDRRREEGADDEERLIEVVVREQGPFDVVASFHEDPELNDTYVYDVGEQFYQLQLNEWQTKCTEHELCLLNGIDDPSDPTLQFEFVNGYNYDSSISNNQGMFEYWILQQNLARRSLTIEAPGTVIKLQKEQLVEMTFDHLILPAFS